jgi:hypothetical protein
MKRRDAMVPKQWTELMPALIGVRGGGQSEGSKPKVERS